VATIRLRQPNPALFALGLALTSLGLMPCVPLLPGLGSLAALGLSWLVVRRTGRWGWQIIAALAVAGVGLILALTQLLSGLMAVWGR